MDVVTPCRLADRYAYNMSTKLQCIFQPFIFVTISAKTWMKQTMKEEL
jgi:hypothetical protein